MVDTSLTSKDVVSAVREAYGQTLDQGAHGVGHYDGCWKDHYPCLIELLLSEIGELRFHVNGLKTENAAFAEREAQLPDETSAHRDTGVTDKNGQRLLEGDHVKVEWLAELGVTELGVTELECEATGTVAYMPDQNTAAWFIKFDQPYKRYVCQDWHYETGEMMLLQTTGDEFTCSFEKLGGSPEEPKAGILLYKCGKCGTPMRCGPTQWEYQCECNTEKATGEQS